MYENFYNLKSSPFRLSPDPGFFFGSKGHSRALAYLRYGLKQKEGFIVVTGSPGTGKTTLARALLQDIGREKIIVAELNTTHLQADDVLRMVTASFGLEYEGASKTTLLRRMETYFLGRYRAGYHTLLIIDEAQNLPFESIEELRMLSNFYSGSHALIQIFLLGQQQFRDSLYSIDLEQLRQRVVASCHLEPLTQVETAEYITHRLELVGWRNDPQISDRAFARIFSLTKGVPRRINTFCDRLLLFGSLEEAHQLKDSHVKLVAHELMYEVSAKNVKLSDIDLDSPKEKKDSILDVDSLNSELLGNFSDDLPERVVETVSFQSEHDSDPIEAVDSAPSGAPGGDHSLKVAANGDSAAVALPGVVADMDVRPNWWPLVATAVDFYRRPGNHEGIANLDAPLADGVTEMLKVAVGKIILTAEMRVEELLNVEDETVRQACLNYIQQVWIKDEADHYRRLGVDSDATLEHIRTHYRYLFRLLQTEQGAEISSQDEAYIRRINQAFSALRSDEKRKEYDAALLAGAKVEKPLDKAREFTISDIEIPQGGEVAYPAALKENSKKRSSGVFVGFFMMLLLVGGGVGYYLFPKEIDDFIASSIEMLKPKEVVVVEEPAPAVAEIPPVIVVPNPVVEERIPEPVVEKPVNPVVVLPKREVIVEPEPVVVAPVPVVVAPAPVAEQPQPKIAPPPVEIEPEVEVVEPEIEAVLPEIVKVPEIADEALGGLVDHFSLVYELGELDEFMALFSKDALSNDDKGWDGIREDYKSLFRSTFSRTIKLQSMRWTKTEQIAVGKGDFVVTVLRRQGDEPRTFNGQIELKVSQTESGLLIKGMYHSYGEDD